MYSVLFVCRQNRYRSPIAEVLLRRRLKDSPSEPEWLIGSAGTWTQDDLPALAGVIAEMAVRGIDLSQHRSHLINQAMVDSYHLILTMDKNQQEALCLEFPHAANRIHLMTEMIGEDWEVNDYDGFALSPYDQVIREIDQLIERGFEKIEALAKDG